MGSIETTGTKEKLLEVEGLKTYFFLKEGTVRAVEGADFSIDKGGTVGIVGESGCGKSVAAFSILQLVDPPGRVVGGSIKWHRSTPEGGKENVVDLAALHPRSREIRTVRGGEISMIFQEPMVSLGPVHTIGSQITEAIRQHQSLGKDEARAKAIEWLDKVGIPEPERRFSSYSFQLSGGMRQRAMIAMALSCIPSLLIADEPTTALDVTTQAQILELMNQLQADLGMAIMLITHNLGVVAENCGEVVVMYLGQVVEKAPTDAIFHDPLHPYTRALLNSVPVLGSGKKGKLDTIEGSVPDAFARPSGCPFHPRCPSMVPGTCEKELVPLYELPDGRRVRCVRQAARAARIIGAEAGAPEAKGKVRA
jgi:oligopeptide/dipeptide ABC transporter ATP-binding protein